MYSMIEMMREASKKTTDGRTECEEGGTEKNYKKKKDTDCNKVQH